MKNTSLLIPHLTHPSWWISCCPFATPSSLPCSSNTHTHTHTQLLLLVRCRPGGALGPALARGLPIVGELFAKCCRLKGKLGMPFGCSSQVYEHWCFHQVIIGSHVASMWRALPATKGKSKLALATG